jgi:hypothetical protein
VKIWKKSRREPIPLARNRASLLTPRRINTGLRQIPYSGAIGLAGLRRVTAQVTRLSHFPYQGAIGLAGLTSLGWLGRDRPG